MSGAQAAGVAALLAAVAAYLFLPPERLGRLFADGRRPGASAGLTAWLRPVEGAPSLVIRVALGVSAGCVVLVTGAGGGPLTAAAALVLGLVVTVGLGRWRPAAQRERRAAVVAELPVACVLIAAALEAGLPLRSAVAIVAEGLHGPLGAALNRLAAAVRLGVPEAQAWAELAEAEPELADLASALRHVVGTGVALATIFRHQGTEALQVRRALAQARARRAGVSSVLPLMACYLPAFVLVGVVPIVGGVASRIFGG